MTEKVAGEVASFNQFAAEYDFWMQTVNDPTTYAQFEEILPDATHNILDVGCGTGQLTLFLAAQGRKATGIDLSEAMIARAQQTKQLQGKNNVAFLVADIAKWQPSEAGYDFIISTFTLHHTDLAITPGKLRRALRPGGRLFIRDLVCRDSAQWRTSRIYHMQRALRDFPKLTRKHGLQAAARIMRFRLNPSWIQHLQCDNVFSAEITRQIYQDHLPGCVFFANEEEYTVVWDAPKRAVKHPAIGSRLRLQSEDESLSTGLPWRQQVWLPELMAKDDVETSIVAVFERQVAQFSKKIAIKSKDGLLTYGQLNAAANRLARAIIEMRGEQTEAIAILLTQPTVTIVALLAVLKAGKAYMVLNPVQPMATLAAMLTDSGSRLLVTDNQSIDMIARRGGEVALLNLDELPDSLAMENLALPIDPNRPAGIYYTSGSTGAPKGIVREHRQLLHSTWHNTNAYQITSSDQHSLLFSPSFTASVPDIFDTLLNGATLYPVDPHAYTMDELTDWLQNEGITLFHPPVTLFRHLIDSLQPEQQFPAVRMVILAGQSIYQQDVERFRRHFAPSSHLLYRLAMTEAGSVTHLMLDQQSKVNGNIPIGYPTADKEIVLLGEDGQEVDLGEVGQIAIRSRYLSSGYWRNPTLTAQKFLPDSAGGDKSVYLTGDMGWMRPDGMLEYGGRADQMVKIRGYRVEMAAIEAALLNHPMVRSAVVTAHEDTKGEKQLVAYLVPSEPAPSIRELRNALRHSLPGYMIPDHFVMLDQLPLLSNGKVDRSALPTPDLTRSAPDTAFVPPATELEKRLADIIAELLGINKVGIHDQFVDLGSNSLWIMRVAARVRDTFEVDIPLGKFFTATTVNELAMIILDHIAGVAGLDEKDALRSE